MDRTLYYLNRWRYRLLRRSDARENARHPILRSTAMMGGRVANEAGSWLTWVANRYGDAIAQTFYRPIPEARVQISVATRLALLRHHYRRGFEANRQAVETAIQTAMAKSRALDAAKAEKNDRSKS